MPTGALVCPTKPSEAFGGAVQEVVPGVVFVLDTEPCMHQRQLLMAMCVHVLLTSRETEPKLSPPVGWTLVQL